MIFAQFKNPQYFKNIMFDIEKILTHAQLHFTPKGITISSLCGSRNSMIELTIPENAFNIYKCIDNTQVGIHFKTLNVILKFYRKNDNIELSIDDDPTILNIAIYNERKLYNYLH